MRNQAELLRDLGIIAPEPEVEVPEPSTSELVLDQLLMAVEELKVALETIPEPVVNVEAQDLSEIVTAVNGLRPGADADEIGKAVANYLKPPKPGEDKLSPTLEALVKSLEKLDFRLKGVGSQAYGGGSVTLQPGQTVGVNNLGDIATETTLDSLRDRTPQLVGTWDYYGGTSGTVNALAGERIIGIAASAGESAGTVAINGGDVVPVPANKQIVITPLGNLVAASVVFTSTDSYFVEVLS